MLLNYTPEQTHSTIEQIAQSLLQFIEAHYDKLKETQYQLMTQHVNKTYQLVSNITSLRYNHKEKILWTTNTSTNHKTTVSNKEYKDK